MRITYITNGITGIGGLERVLSIKASYFADNLLHEVHIVTVNEQEKLPFYPFSSRIIFHNVQTQGKGISYLISLIHEINPIVKKIKSDVICVCDDGLKGLYVPLWIHRGNSKLIYERHASLKFCPHSWQRMLMRLGGFLYHHVVVLTPYNRHEWMSNNIVVIPNPLSIHPSHHSSLCAKRIICVGSLSYNKGYDLLMEAWARIAYRYPDWCICIYGKGDIASFQQEATVRGVSKQMKFNPPSNQIEEQYLESSIFVLPSRSEGFGMVLIEAMSCGLPCISFDCPCGPRDIITHGEDGFLVKPQNTYELGERIAQLIESEKLRRQMGEAARTNATRYEMGKIAVLWETIFKRK